VPWNMDPAKFVVNALAPAIISKVIIDQNNRSMEVIVPDDQLSLAIGKRGQNVRLASKLTNWRIDVNSESRYGRKKQAGYQALLQLPHLTNEMADRLYEAGITSLEDLAEASATELMDLTRQSKAVVEEMKIQVQELLSVKTDTAAEPMDEAGPVEPQVQDTLEAGEPPDESPTERVSGE